MQHNINKKEKDSENLKIKRANYILERAIAMNRVKEKYSNRWADYEKIWKMVAEKRTGEDEWRASLPDTWSYATIKTAQSAFVDSKISPIITRHQDDPLTKSQDLKDLYTDNAEIGNQDEEMYFIRLDAFKLGNGYGKTVHVKESRYVWDIKKFDPEKNTFQWERKLITEFNDPKTVRVSPYLMLVDDLARFPWNTVRDCIEIEVMGRDEAKARYGHLVKDWTKIPETTSLLDQLKSASTTTIAETDGTGIRGTDFETLQAYNFFAPGFDWSNDVVEILHYWNKGIETPSKCHDSYEILINGHPVQVDIENKPSPVPYIHKQLPYFRIGFSPYSGDEHFCAGIIEVGQSESKEIQKEREMMTDRQKISLFAPAFSDVNDEIDQRVLKLKPFSIVRTKGGVPRRFDIPGITSADLELQTRHEASFKRAVGVDERILGVESTGPNLTATEVSFLREAAMKRLREFAFLYKNAILQHEIRLKFSLFKQYFSSPLSREKSVKDDKGIRRLKAKFKDFKIKTGNTYIRKEVTPSFFEGEIDVDIDLQLLIPMTAAQMVTVWSQAIRDVVPAVQAGIVDYSITKLYDEYITALTQRNPDTFREDNKALSIEMAEAEHQLYADPNTNKEMEKILPNGTQPPYLNQEHILKHQELRESDVNIEPREKLKLNEHIMKDINNLQVSQVAQPPTPTIQPGAFQGVGGISSPSPSVPQPPLKPPTQPSL